MLWLHKKIACISIILVFVMMIFGCSSDGDPTVKVVNNEAPKYQDGSYVSLELLYRIPTYYESGNDSYEIDKIANLRVDNDQNLYVLSTFNSEIVVFDPNGRYLRKFGGAGQGPTELGKPYMMFVEDESIFVLHSMNKFKELSLQGEYVSQTIVSLQNFFSIDKVGDLFYVYHGSFASGGFDLITMQVTKTDGTFSNNVTIFENEILFSKLKSSIDSRFWLAVSDNGEFFYPRDNWNEYMINKYDGNGNLLVSFGRDYDPVPYSDEARKYYEKVYERFIVDDPTEALPTYPHVIIRKSLVDARRNLWVLSGEILDESYNPDFESTIDIFDPDGIWLTSFKSNAISRSTDIHNDRIYTISLIDDNTQMQYVDVYQIVYNY